MHRFYAPGYLDGRDVQLPEEEAQHLARVLRLKTGEIVAIFDGKGKESLARVEAVDARHVIVRPTERRAPAAEPAIALTLAQALLKSDKMDRVVRDAVMLGVVAVQPFVSLRTDVPRAVLRTGARRDRWQRTVISSAKQSGRAVVPDVLDPIDFVDMLKTPSGGTRLMFVEPSATRPGIANDLRSLEGTVPTHATIVIGPEGGWDDREVDAAVEAGMVLVTFGNRTLRADAAGAVAIALVQYAWRDM